MQKVKWFNNPYGLSEISQATGMIFSFVTAKGIQCHPWVKCRDFLHDAVRSTLQKVKCAIYGFNYDPSAKGFAPVDTKAMRMLVSQQAILRVDKAGKKALEEFNQKMLSSLKLLNHYERLAKVSLSSLTQYADDTNNWWYFRGPQFWLKSPSLVSMYTFLIRLGDKNITFEDRKGLTKEYLRIAKLVNKGGDNDIGYIKIVGKHMETVIKKSTKLLLDGEEGFDKDYFDPDVKIGAFHNNAGIRSLCAGQYFNKKKVL